MNEDTSCRTPFAPLQCRILEPPNTKSCSKLPKAYCYSPLEAENIRKQRAKEFGLSPLPTDSFLHNQSFPGVCKNPENGNLCVDMGNIYRCSIDNFTGDELNAISFSPPKHNTHETKHFDDNFVLYKHIVNNSPNKNQHFNIYNPKKAVLTIDARRTEILTANKAAVRLLNLKEDEGTVRLSDFLSAEDQCLFSDVALKPNGKDIIFSGKVMTLVTDHRENITVSGWAKHISDTEDTDSRLIVIMEPIERLSGSIRFNSMGTIVHCDKNFATLYGFDTVEPVIDSNVKDFIPTLELEWENQQNGIPECGLQLSATGRIQDNFNFPLTINIKHYTSPDESVQRNSEKLSENEPLFEGIVSVFSNISGLITIFPSGIIKSCNTNFSMTLFGYSMDDLTGEHISTILPSFYEDIECRDTSSVALPPFGDDDDTKSKCDSSDGRTTADSLADPPRPINPLAKSSSNEVKRLEFGTPTSRDRMASAVDRYFKDLVDKEMAKIARESDFLLWGGTLDPDNKYADSYCDKNDEQSTSSLCNSFQQMSCSKSQDTLHSGTNCMAESDMNANPLELAESLVSQDSSALSNQKCSKAVNGDVGEDCDKKESDNKDSESSESESDNSDSESSKSESDDSDNESSDSEESYDSEDNVCSDNDCKEKEENSSCDIDTPSISEGVFKGLGKHKDGTDLAIEYCIKKIVLDTGAALFCIWVSRDEIKEGSPPSKTSNISKKESSKTCNFSNKESSKASEASDKRESASSSSSDSQLDDEEYFAGEFSEHYSVVTQMAKGAFGCIKQGYRKTDGRMMMIKFIRKNEVYKYAWVEDKALNKTVPLEISLLTTFDHPNIVKVIDVFENEQCFSMVMEQHGMGYDLFEFIDRSIYLPEPLASYIFRQIVSAVSYIHNLGVLHRDIKDENVIINEKFQIKLIDFGSAAFMREKPFSVFCGTTEYCCPEVLRGDRYRGPELEMFALGVTLHTIIHCENPFADAYEILKGKFMVRTDISDSLAYLIRNMLRHNIKKRLTLPEVENHPWVTQPVNIEDYKYSEIVPTADEYELNPGKYVRPSCRLTGNESLYESSDESGSGSDSEDSNDAELKAEGEAAASDESNTTDSEVEVLNETADQPTTTDEINSPDSKTE